MNGLPYYKAYPRVRSDLICDGWLTPNSYDKVFAPIEDVSAVYLFLLVDQTDFKRCFVAYVGMSQNLKQRLTGHPIRSEIDLPRHWTMTWFKPSSVEDLRRKEASYIRKFDPPWNIAGRQRGVSAL